MVVKRYGCQFKSHPRHLTMVQNVKTAVSKTLGTKIVKTSAKRMTLNLRMELDNNCLSFLVISIVKP
ncbi:hypothetical protein TNCV_1528681 [Trichonephila clavipes]|nr:hypothetical protein TNCV_1528681 [Trichonephila clavipes]